MNIYVKTLIIISSCHLLLSSCMSSYVISSTNKHFKFNAGDTILIAGFGHHNQSFSTEAKRQIIASLESCNLRNLLNYHFNDSVSTRVIDHLDSYTQFPSVIDTVLTSRVENVKSGYLVLGYCYFKERATFPADVPEEIVYEYLIQDIDRQKTVAKTKITMSYGLGSVDLGFSREYPLLALTKSLRRFKKCHCH